MVVDKRMQDAAAGGRRSLAPRLRIAPGRTVCRPRAWQRRVIGYAPPLCCTADDIDTILEKTCLTFDQTLEDPDTCARR